MKLTKEYTVYFEIYGKKMRSKTFAKSKKDAQEKIMNKIIFHKTYVDKEDEFNQAMGVMEDILKFLDIKE